MDTSNPPQADCFFILQYDTYIQMMAEWWNGGMEEWWNGGMVEWWNGRMVRAQGYFYGKIRK
jgi:hypothetical protein